MTQKILKDYLIKHDMKVGKTFAKKGRKYKLLEVYENFILAEECKHKYKESFTYYQLIREDKDDEE